MTFRSPTSPTVALFLAAALTAPIAAASPAPAGVSGKVLLPSGKPAAGAQVWLGYLLGRQQGFQEGRADAQGVFRLQPPQGAAADGVWLGAAAPGAAPTWISLQETQGPVRPRFGLTLRLPAGVTATGFVVGRDGKPRAGVTVTASNLGVESGGSLFLRMGTSMVPPSVLKTAQARSGADGAFRIPGLPPGRILYVTLPADYRSPENWVKLNAQPLQRLGILPAVRWGSLQVSAQAGGQPAGAGIAWLRRVVPTPPDELGRAVSRTMSEAERGQRKIELEPNGVGLVEKLAPGKYEIAYHGRVTPVEIPEGDAGRLQVTARALSASGVVKDDAGRPISGAVVNVTLGERPVAWPPGPENPVRTDERGNWTIEDFPWEAPQILVRARTETGLAEWRGDPATLKGSTVPLTLRAGTLMIVKGRLLLPGGQPLAGGPVALFTEQDGRRQAVAVSKADADGRFQLAGVPRGIRFAVGSVAGEVPLEGPFQESPLAGAALDLGDVRLHASVDSSRFATPPEQFWPAPLPASKDVDEARDAAFDFITALRAGNAPAAFAKLSRLSLRPAPDFPAFLEGGAPELLVMQPGMVEIRKANILGLRVNPAGLILSRFWENSEPDRKVLMRAMDRPDWVTLAYGTAGGVKPLALMHRDPDGWKAVDGLDSTDPGSYGPGDEKLLTISAPPAPPEAAAAAALFVKAWQAGDFARMAALAHPDLWGKPQKPEQAWAERPEPMRPSPAGIELRPVADFSAWDLLSLYGSGLVLTPHPGRSPSLEPHEVSKDAHAGNLAVLTYQVGGHGYYMLLRKSKTGWQVAEPALPMGGSR